MAEKKKASTVIVSQVVHDLRARKSYATVIWKDHEEKKLGLPIPFGTKIEDVEVETERAIESFQAEIADLSVKVP
jgi:hypothetical protein